MGLAGSNSREGTKKGKKMQQQQQLVTLVLCSVAACTAVIEKKAFYAIE
jgi:hypothetical protein